MIEHFLNYQKPFHQIQLIKTREKLPLRKVVAFKHCVHKSHFRAKAASPCASCLCSHIENTTRLKSHKCYCITVMYFTWWPGRPNKIQKPQHEFKNNKQSVPFISLGFWDKVLHHSVLAQDLYTLNREYNRLEYNDLQSIKRIRFGHSFLLTSGCPVSTQPP